MNNEIRSDSIGNIERIKRMYDPIGQAQSIQMSEHTRIHQGNAFVAAFEAIDGIDYGEQLQFVSTVGERPIHLKEREIQISNGTIEITLWEDISFTVATTVQQYALNRTNIRPSGFDILSEPETLDLTGATPLHPYKIFGAEAGPPQIREAKREFEWVLKPNTTYALTLENISTNLDDIERAGIFWFWYIARD